MCTPTFRQWGRGAGSWEQRKGETAPLPSSKGNPRFPSPLTVGLGNAPVSQAFESELRMPWVPPKRIAMLFRLSPIHDGVSWDVTASEAV